MVRSSDKKKMMRNMIEASAVQADCEADCEACAVQADCEAFAIACQGSRNGSIDLVRTSKEPDPGGPVWFERAQKWLIGLPE